MKKWKMKVNYSWVIWNLFSHALIILNFLDKPIWFYKLFSMFFQPICPSRFNQRDAYETSYNESHRPFSQHERRAAAHWENKDQRERQWLRDPITSKKLQMRVPIPPSSVTKSMSFFKCCKIRWNIWLYNNYDKLSIISLIINNSSFFFNSWWFKPKS